MKKIYFLTVLIIMLFSVLTACARGEDPIPGFDRLSPEGLAKEELIEAYSRENPKHWDVEIECFYGIYGDSYSVAMIFDSKRNYDTAIGTEIIAEREFRYRDGNRPYVLIKGELHSLSYAYGGGYLTESDVAEIWNLHKQFYENSIEVKK